MSVNDARNNMQVPRTADDCLWSKMRVLLTLKILEQCERNEQLRTVNRCLMIKSFGFLRASCNIGIIYTLFFLSKFFKKLYIFLSYCEILPPLFTYLVVLLYLHFTFTPFGLTYSTIAGRPKNVLKELPQDVLWTHNSIRNILWNHLDMLKRSLDMHSVK